MKPLETTRVFAHADFSITFREYERMTDSMVERVALATCSALPCICKHRMGFEGMPCLDRGRRGIEAMREPTEAMSLAGWKALEGNPVSPPLQCWDAMIAAALAEPVPK